jgi:hypothetical protein
LKKFKDFISELVADNYGGKKLITTHHYYDRLDTRHHNDDSVKHAVKDIFRKTVDHLKSNDYGDQSKFLVYSRKHNQAVAFSHQHNTNDRKDKRKHLVATTIFPVGDKHANPSVKLIHVEGYSPEFIAYVNEFITEEQRTEYPLSEVLVEDVEFYFLHGQLHNLPFTEFIEVD